MTRHRRQVSQDMRDEWREEYRELSNDIHHMMVNDQQVPEDKSSRLRSLGQRLRAQSGE